MFSLRKIYTLIFLIGIFFIPFNEFTGLSFLGEYSNEASAYFFFVGSFVLLIDILLSRKTVIPFNYTPIIFIGVYLIWIIISSLINLPEMSKNTLKGTGGIERFFRQFISVFITLVLFIYLYINVLRKWSIEKIFYRMRFVFLLSFSFVFLYGLLEIMYAHFGMTFLAPIIKAFSYFPFYEFPNYFSDRISSVSFEAPFLAIFLITVAAWMFSYILTEKTLVRFIPTICVLILTYYSDSRTALIIILFQLFLFVLILMRQQVYRKYILLGGGALVLLGVLFFSSPKGAKAAEEITEKIERLDFQKNLLNNVSNRSRFGMQYAQLQVFKEHPIVGVGLGQQAYYSKYHYPPWAATSNYEFKLWYKNPNVRNFPPGYNLYIRILAENGIIGFLIFALIIATALYKSIQLYFKKDVIKNILGVVLTISIVGIAINWLQIDTYRLYGFWLFLAILYAVDRNQSNKNKVVLDGQ
ncbi:MAG: O-antigen ligase [Glaciecola sp.]